ncbi:Clp protease N-terminal domain-containing protein [Cellulomonas sp. HZM]|uniref:Clp protease N-terminal domain-containing protein n=1 Tax=Cellulomonas sp. HZM TaxID=1454010 RepID=UPI0004934A75|nr:Clp protease N-terminal domain-containing protein [Cellulomonas sp. HZM]
MLERFSAQARDAVTAAHDQARSAGAGSVTSAHLLAAVVADPRSIACVALAAAGTDPAAVARAARHTDDGIDADALAAVGIDLAAVRAQVEHEFGAGALDHPHARARRRLAFAPDAKKTLELALREAVAGHDRRIDPGHLLLATTRLEHRAPAARVLAACAVDVAAVRTQVERQRAEHPAA